MKTQASIGTPGLLAHVGYRLDVHHQRSGSTVGSDIEPMVDDLSTKTSDRVELSFPRTRETDVCRLDTEAFHEMEQLDLDLERRIDN